MFASLTLSELPPDEDALRLHVRATIATVIDGMTLDRRARTWMGFNAEFSRALGRAGLLGVTLPERYGGAELGPFSRFIIVEELLAAGAPVAAHWIADRQSGPLILTYGTEAQRQHYLPKIARGELFFCIGMSEPGAGSDLAGTRDSLRSLST